MLIRMRPVRFAAVVPCAITFWASVALAQKVLPSPEPPFQGVANRTLAGSKPDYPRPVQAPQGAPNILLILIDDAGFGNPSTFGGPVQTPTLDRLARDGLRYNRFHVTALCSPTRAALLSGPNHHAVGFGSIAEAHSGWPGYNAMWPRSAASIAEILRDSGYSTGVFGKWHLTPDTLPVRRHDREGGLRAALSRRSVVRDEYGRRTAAFVVVRRAMGMPP